MAGNTLGTMFRITTFGESHGPGIGCVIDGVPAGIPLAESELAAALARRRPGQALTSPRREPDHPRILSGCHGGRYETSLGTCARGGRVGCEWAKRNCGATMVQSKCVTRLRAPLISHSTTKS